VLKGSGGTATTLAGSSSKCRNAHQERRSQEPSMTTAQAVPLLVGLAPQHPSRTG